jgi:outer membrane biogenesis lipoprotein LolB
MRGSHRSWDGQQTTLPENVLYILRCSISPLFEAMMMSRILLLLFISMLLCGCSEEQQNRLSRLGVTWLEGNYRVTYADGEHVKSWVVRDSKVTSEPEKGYYYFWVKDGKARYYVQTPIARTYIEEIP